MTTMLGVLGVGDHREWREYFRALLIGSTAAQRRLPNPKLLARWAAKTADCGLEEARRRRGSAMIPTLPGV